MAENIAIRDIKDEAEKRKEIAKILLEMKSKMKELETIRKQAQRKIFEEIDPKKSKAMLEEIKVPSLEMIREKNRA